MAASATLTEHEIAVLSVPKCTYAAVENARGLERWGNSLTDSGAFEEALRLKNTLELYEERARTEPSWENLSILLNCEYQLAALTKGIELRYNPFLTHWVEAAIRLRNRVPERERHVRSLSTYRAPSACEIDTVRAAMISLILIPVDLSALAAFTPEDTPELLDQQDIAAPGVIAAGVRMLEEEGIWAEGQFSLEDGAAAQQQTRHQPGTASSDEKATDGCIEERLKGTRQREGEAILEAHRLIPDGLKNGRKQEHKTADSQMLKGEETNGYEGRRTPAKSRKENETRGHKADHSFPGSPAAGEHHVSSSTAQPRGPLSNLLNGNSNGSGKRPTYPQSEPSEAKGNAPSKQQQNQKEPQSWQKALLSKLENDPDRAIAELTHLPVELPYLDFLTTLLQDGTLTRLSIDPSPIIRNYLQHALRIAEQMGQPPPPPISPSSASSTPSTSLTSSTSTSTSSSAQHANTTTLQLDTDQLDHGRAPQARAVRLLVLFLRNVIRKDLVPLQKLYFEIQEIRVRYLWIREVREFRKFVEGGELVDGERG